MATSRLPTRRRSVLRDTNALLAAMGFGARSFADYDDLVASVSSMGVALYEKLFQFHLEDVVRVPATPEDYVHNAQRVVDALAGALLDETFDTERLTGASLCDGDVESIAQFVRMFRQIYEILYSDSSVSRSALAEEEERRVEEERREEEQTERRPREEPSTDVRNSRESKSKATSRVAASVKSSNTRASAKPIDGRRTTVTSASRVERSRSTAMPVESVTAKKRTRRVEKTSQRSSKSASQRQRDEALEQELLTTQKYGRYVPVPHRSRREHADDRGDDLGSDAELGLNEEELVSGETYFGGVSSVSGASGSEASIHFMEEEGEFAKNFSVVQSHSSPGSKDSPEADSTPDRQPRNGKSRNQQDAEDDAVHDDEGTTSPVKKKLATSKKTLSPAKIQSAQRQKDGAKPSVLYPLLPETSRRDRTSKAHKELLRYKIELKDHLQELRQREFCQRQHLERAYRLGEHAANVERIRARRFEQNLRLHRISIGLEAKTQEEKQLRDAMQQMLHLEKEKLRDEHRTTAQTLQQIQRDHAEREQALETFYATQIQLVKEQTRRELKERETVEKAHRMASEQMVREMRRERERELTTLLREKQHLAEVRRFRHATQLTQAIEKGTELPVRQGDAFYAAAMKARQLRAKTTPASAKTTKHDALKRTKAVYGGHNEARRTVMGGSLVFG